MTEDFEFSLSERGKEAISKSLRVDLELWQEAAEDAYEPMHNPSGKIALNVAENVLSWSTLQAKLQLLASEAPPDWVSGYTSTIGHPSVRESLACFFSQHHTEVSINPDHLALSAGASSVIETTGFLLANAGDVAAIPAPAYPVYSSDLGTFSQVHRYDILTHNNLNELSAGPSLTVGHLYNAKASVEAQGKSLRMLILTSPDNPTGQMYSRSQLELFANWCIKHKIHLIVNEIYGLSRVNVQHPAITDHYDHNKTYCSIAKIMDEKKSSYLHQWYAFSKDFGISGFRIGFLHTHNGALLKGYENINLTRCVSNHTQWLVSELINDDLFVKEYINSNQQKITENYLLTIKTLDNLGVQYAPARGSLFVWADFSPFLDTQTQESENRLWLDIYANTSVLLTPGEGFGHEGYGLFRIVFTAVPKTHLIEALHRLENYLASRTGRFIK